MSSCPGPNLDPNLPYVRYFCFKLMGVGKGKGIVWLVLGLRAKVRGVIVRIRPLLLERS